MLRLTDSEMHLVKEKLNLKVKYSHLDYHLHLERVKDSTMDFLTHYLKVKYSLKVRVTLKNLVRPRQMGLLRLKVSGSETMTEKVKDSVMDSLMEIKIQKQMVMLKHLENVMVKHFLKKLLFLVLSPKMQMYHHQH
jgi:hypothetical protein